MRIYILCEDSKIELARENSNKVFPIQENKEIHPKLAQIKENLGLNSQTLHLRIPVSATGNLPVTHWFCFLNASEETYAKIMEIREYSTVEESGPKEFLEKWNLKIINSFPIS